MALSGNICRPYAREKERYGTVGGYCGETGRGCASIEFLIWRRLLLSAMRTVKRESLHAGRLIAAGKPRRGGREPLFLRSWRVCVRKRAFYVWLRAIVAARYRRCHLADYVASTAWRNATAYS